VKTATAATFVVALICLTQPCLSENIAHRQKTISEEEVRILSARLYRNILVTACKNGWRYPRKLVVHGFKRHFQELKLQLSNHGYTIVSGTVASDDRIRRRSMAMVGGNRKSPTFGCARAYWLETRG
jgi:hypothetical protein